MIRLNWTRFYNKIFVLIGVLIIIGFSFQSSAWIGDFIVNNTNVNNITYGDEAGLQINITSLNTSIIKINADLGLATKNISTLNSTLANEIWVNTTGDVMSGNLQLEEGVTISSKEYEHYMTFRSSGINYVLK